MPGANQETPLLQMQERNEGERALVEETQSGCSETRPSSTRLRQRPHLYQSQEEEAREREQKKKEKEIRSQEQDRLLFPIDSQQEEESHDWTEGARIGEAEHPGPPFKKRWLPKNVWQGTRKVPQNSQGPWGQERRQPGFAPPARQAWGVGWPHQKQPQQGTLMTRNSATSGQRWGTGTTPTISTTNGACGVSRYDGQPSLNQMPPRSMQMLNVQNHTNNPTMVFKLAPCKFGTMCLKKAICRYQHPPMAQAQGKKNSLWRTGGQ